MKRITLCADDYAQSPAINRAILRLVEMGRLDAVSCLTLSPTWKADARNLLAAENGQRVGLHFNLTLPFDQPARKVSTIMASCLLRKIDKATLLRTFDSQWQSFIRFFGRPPDFIDGHQHVHVFPVVREIITTEIAARSPSCSIRSLSPPSGLPSHLLKRSVLECFNRRMVTLIRKKGLSSNHTFAGFRSYPSSTDFPVLFNRWLSAATDDTLIMCHPGFAGSDTTDPIRNCRPDEFLYLSSPEFENDLRAADISTAPRKKVAPLIHGDFGIQPTVA